MGIKGDRTVLQEVNGISHTTNGSYISNSKLFFCYIKIGRNDEIELETKK